MTSADSLNRLGVDFLLRGDFEPARLHYLAALRVEPDFLPALANLAVVLGHQNNLSAAVVVLRRLLNHVPNDGHQLSNLGNLLMRLKRYGESREVMERVAGIMPDSPSTWYNLALLSYREGKNAEAVEHIDRAMALGASGPTIENDRAHFLLALGEDLGAALRAYEARWDSLIHLPPWDFHIPEWQGEDLRGKSLLLHAEQGYGDTIMCARFAKDLTLRGARVTLCLPRDLCSLFETLEWKSIRVIDLDSLNPDVAKEFDYQSPMYGAMRWLKVEQANINSVPYLTCPKVVGSQIRTPAAYNLGICWASGFRGNEYDWRRRVAPLELWLPLAELPGIQLYSLQKGPDEGDIAALGAEALIIDESASFRTWADTAAFVDQLDLVISVDTAVAHLAGAMGKEVWMLAQHNHCWRWWNIYGESGRPWYSSMTILRQTEPDDWGTQLGKVRERLRMRGGTLREAA